MTKVYIFKRNRHCWTVPNWITMRPEQRDMIDLTEESITDSPIEKTPLICVEMWCWEVWRA